MKINMCREKCLKRFGDLRIGDVFLEIDTSECWVQMKITPNNEGNAVELTSGEVYGVQDDLMVELVETELNIL